MEAFKIGNFIRENPGSPPPKFVALKASEVGEFAEKLLTTSGQPKGTPEDLIRWLSAHADPVQGVNLDEGDMPLRKVFDRSGITPGPVLYVEWGSLRDIDRFETEELERLFYDVWYPGADDIEIFDDTLEWLMFVRHYGGVEIWRPLGAGISAETGRGQG